MKKIFVITLVLSCVISVCAQPEKTPGMAQTELLKNVTRDAVNKLNNPAGKIDLSSPESTVRSFAWALNRGDLKLASQCVQNPAPHEKLHEVEALLKPYLRVLKRVDDFRSYFDGSRATVTSSLSYVNDFGKGGVLIFSDRLHLQKINDSWLLVPDMNMTQPELVPISEDILAQAAKYIADYDAFTNMRAYSISQRCQVGMREVGKMLHQLVQDSDGKFPERSDLKKQLKPYDVEIELYFCPNDEMQPPLAITASDNWRPSGAPLPDDWADASDAPLVYTDGDGVTHTLKPQQLSVGAPGIGFYSPR